jgi:hypothetical protein
LISFSTRFKFTNASSSVFVHFIDLVQTINDPSARPINYRLHLFVYTRHTIFSDIVANIWKFELPMLSEIVTSSEDLTVRYRLLVHSSTLKIFCTIGII